MAAHGEHSQSVSGDFAEHVRTWKGFTTFIKWSMAGIGLLMVLLAVFRTNG